MEYHFILTHALLAGGFDDGSWLGLFPTVVECTKSAVNEIRENDHPRALSIVETRRSKLHLRHIDWQDR